MTSGNGRTRTCQRPLPRLPIAISEPPFRCWKVDSAAVRSKLPSSIARWETDTVEPGYSTLRRVLQAPGFDIPPVLVPYERDLERDAQVQELRELTPQERMARLLARLDKPR